MCVNTVVIVWMNYSRQIELEAEIAEKEKASHRLAVTLKEKEVLIAEIHHRVKNNLAVVRGLLNMQMNTTTNDIARETLRESVSRVSAMALIHQKLYSNSTANSIDLQKYVAELVREVANSYQQDGNFVPKVHVDVGDTLLDLNRAVPCGLILNELLTNAFKHAFAGKKDGEIDIRIAPAANGFIQLVVADNGKGISNDFHLETTDSLGMTIIRSLSEQLDGTFTFQGEPHKGTRATLIFPHKNEVKRPKTVS
jgi:two-component sensor histidine kinase